jgi:hypothetical protein
VEATRNLPHEIITLGFRMAKDIVHHTAPFHACDDMFNADTETGDHLVLGFVVGTPLLSSWFFLWLIGTNMIRFKPLEACIFKEHTTRRNGVAFLITNAFVMHASSHRPTEITHETLCKLQNEVILHGMCFFFTALLLLLLDGIVWTLDATCGSINDAIHRDTKCQGVFQMLRVPFRQHVRFASRHF